MASRVRFEDLSASQRLLLLAGIVLVALSFWFPNESPLHGGGGSTLGLLMLIGSVWGMVSPLPAFIASGACMVCIVGGFSYRYDHHTGLVLSWLGIGLAVMALVMHIAGRAMAHGRTKPS